MLDVVASRPNRPPSRAILALPVLPEICGSEEGKPILSRQLSIETRSRLLAEISEIETLLCSTLSEAAIDRSRMMLSAALVVRSDDAATVRMEEAAWSLVIGDDEINGHIPDWAVEKAAREFMAGVHGKFFPKVAEFVTVCKRIVAQTRWAAKERRQILDAKVITRPSADEGARRAAMVERIKATSPLFREPVKPAREVVPPDDWEARRAAVLERATELDARP